MLKVEANEARLELHRAARQRHSMRRLVRPPVVLVAHHGVAPKAQVAKKLPAQLAVVAVAPKIVASCFRVWGKNEARERRGGRSGRNSPLVEGEWVRREEGQGAAQA